MNYNRATTKNKRQLKQNWLRFPVRNVRDKGRMGRDAQAQNDPVCPFGYWSYYSYKNLSVE